MNVESIIVTSAAGAALLGVVAHWIRSGVKWLAAGVRAAQSQLTPNGGGSMLDKVAATDLKVKAQGLQLDAQDMKLDRIVAQLDALQAVQRLEIERQPQRRALTRRR